MRLQESEIRKKTRRKYGNSGRKGPKTSQELAESGPGTPLFPVVPSGKVENFNAKLRKDLITHVGDLNMGEVAEIIPQIEGFPTINDSSNKK